MSQHNRRRRAEKQRARSQRPRPEAAPSEPPSVFGRIPAAGPELLQRLLQAVARGFPDVAANIDFVALPSGQQQAALQAQYQRCAQALIECGWTPVDLYEIARRRGDEMAGRYLLDVAAEVTARYPASRVHPRWQAQLTQLGATAAPSLRHRPEPWPACRDALIELAATLVRLPAIEFVLPSPGREQSVTVDQTGISPAVLRRVRGLLAKAEATDFDEEAEALSAKAQSLMTRYSIDRALADAPATDRAEPSVRRIWLDAPYVVAKASLVNAVAQANRSRCVISEHLGYVTVLGFDTDLEVVELLSTSLLLQVTRAIRTTGSHTTRSGVSRTRSFRQSFLVAYAARIGERLREAAAATEAEADTEHGGSLLPVLASRERDVAGAFATVFPRVVERSVSVSNSAGWGAGRAAADLAQLDVRRSLSEPA